jgi:hypothetical protein
MNNFESNPAECKPETRASDCAADESVEIAQPMNDVFSSSFVSKLDPFFTSSGVSSNREQGEIAT